MSATPTYRLHGPVSGAQVFSSPIFLHDHLFVSCPDTISYRRVLPFISSVDHPLGPVYHRGNSPLLVTIGSVDAIWLAHWNPGQVSSFLPHFFFLIAARSFDGGQVVK